MRRVWRNAGTASLVLIVVIGAVISIADSITAIAAAQQTDPIVRTGATAPSPAASSIPCERTPRMVFGARLATTTTRRPTRLSGPHAHSCPTAGSGHGVTFDSSAAEPGGR